jgi:hypothetical protein
MPYDFNFLYIYYYFFIIYDVSIFIEVIKYIYIPDKVYYMFTLYVPNRCEITTKLRAALSQRVRERDIINNFIYTLYIVYGIPYSLKYDDVYFH